jgi:hypothetical protein
MTQLKSYRTDLFSFESLLRLKAICVHLRLIRLCFAFIRVHSRVKLGGAIQAGMLLTSNMQSAVPVSRFVPDVQANFFRI